MTGFIHRMMPPVDFNCGEIPPECFDESLSQQQIMKILSPIYLSNENIEKLCKEHNFGRITAEMALNIMMEIDSSTIWLAQHL